MEKYTDVFIEDKKQEFEVDSGARFTLLPESEYYRLGITASLQPTNIRFRSYTQTIFEPLGMVQVSVRYKNRKSNEIMFIVPSDYPPLLGRAWIRHLEINLAELDKKQSNSNIQIVLSVDSSSEIITTYQEIFQPKVECIPNATYSLQLREKAKPVFIKEREIPHAVREKVDTELDNLERDGIITKVDVSDWGSPLVIIPKPDGTVRLCVDYKMHVNPCLKDAHYPIRKIDDILKSKKV